MRVVLVETPAVMKHLFEAYRDLSLDEDTCFIVTFGITPFKNIHPQGLKYSDYPVLRYPSSTPCPGGFYDNPEHFVPCVRYGKGIDPVYASSKISVEECRQLLNMAVDIIFACDFDHRGVASFHQFIDEFVPHRCNEVFPAYFMHSYSCDFLEKCVKKPTDTSDERYNFFRNAGLVKRYFDYNFMLNSQAILSRAYRAATARKGDFISKYQLQLLYWLRKSGSISYIKLIECMDRKWTGTGRYNRSHLCDELTSVIGTAASNKNIIEGLGDMGLISRIDHQVEITPSGISFLNLLHPDCEDSDLPFRIGLWMQQPFEQAKLKIDRYLNTFFGRQMKFESKIGNARNWH